MFCISSTYHVIGFGVLQMIDYFIVYNIIYKWANLSNTNLQKFVREHLYRHPELCRSITLQNISVHGRNTRIYFELCSVGMLR